jgi:hypothetical protein
MKVKVFSLQDIIMAPTYASKKSPIYSGSVKTGKETLEHLPPLYRMVAEQKIQNNEWELVESLGAVS